MPDYTWIQTVLEKWGAKNKAYDSDVDGVFDLGAIPTITRDKLEYPTEDVYLIYLESIEKAEWRWEWDLWYGHLVTKDTFADKRVWAMLHDKSALIARRDPSVAHYLYYAYIDTSQSTKDIIIQKHNLDTITEIASIAEDLSDRIYKGYLQVVGSTISVSISNGPNTYETSVTDTDFASGAYGAGGIAGGRYSLSAISARLRAPATPLPPAKAIVETEIAETEIIRDQSGNKLLHIKPLCVQDLKEISELSRLPDFLYQEAKKYEILKAKGFTDEEIEALLGYIPQHHVDLASVTWGAFDHKEGYPTMLITITGDNPYQSGAINQQIEHAKSKNLKVLKPPRDYSEAVEQHRQLRQHFSEWIAGKDNYAYQTLGHEDFEKFQVADTYHGNIVEGYKPDAYKNVPDWEMRRTLAMWKDRLKRAEVAKLEAEKHLKKLEEVEKKGW